ncbi:MAG: NAD-dependent DNA ligase LigA [Synoicihabitans sp.]
MRFVGFVGCALPRLYGALIVGTIWVTSVAAAPADSLLEKVAELRAQIAYHDELYFQKAAPEITDYEYDLLKLELRRLESEAGLDDQAAGSKDDRSPNADQIAHGRPMLSLKKGYTEEDVADFYRRVMEASAENVVRFSVEPKFDGIAVSVVLERGELVSAATRGNGAMGENVTAQVNAIRGLNYEWEFDTSRPRIERIELRGEIYLTHDAFDRLNRERKAGGLAEFRHPRSVAAGTVKLSDLGEVAARGLSLVFHGWGDVSPAAAEPESVMAFQRWLQQRGLPFVRSARFLEPANASELNARVARQHATFRGVPIDGMVIKVDSVQLQRTLDHSPTAPNWALARKFSPPREETILRNIVWQIGRTGMLTPVAEFDPVVLGGATIRRATLSNAGEIQRRDLRMQDVVWIEKAGEIIPQVSGVQLDRRSDDSRPYRLPTLCPSCSEGLITGDDHVQLSCGNYDCPDQVVQRLVHFVSKGAMDIKGVGPAMARRLVESGLVNCPSDLYVLETEQLVALPGVGEKSAQRLLREIDASRTASFDRWIIAMGFPGIGPNGAKLLVRELADLSDLLVEVRRTAAFAALGQAQAEKLRTHLSRPQVADSLSRLGAIAVEQ